VRGGPSTRRQKEPTISGGFNYQTLDCVESAVCATAHAKDYGQWDGYHLTDEQKAWFPSVTNSAGYKCCDDSDGYPVDYEMRPDNQYWVHFQSHWFPVPDNAVRRHVGNPTGHGVAWFQEYERVMIINCFVPVAEY
jgi:hypothetical protein